MARTIQVNELIVPITIEYLSEDNIYKVSCPALQGCHAWGVTLDDAMRAIPGNIKKMLDARRTNGDSIPALFKRTDAHTSLVLRMVPA